MTLLPGRILWLGIWGGTTTKGLWRLRHILPTFLLRRFHEDFTRTLMEIDGDENIMDICPRKLSRKVSTLIEQTLLKKSMASTLKASLGWTPRLLLLSSSKIKNINWMGSPSKCLKMVKLGPKKNLASFPHTKNELQYEVHPKSYDIQFPSWSSSRAKKAMGSNPSANSYTSICFFLYIEPKEMYYVYIYTLYIYIHMMYTIYILLWI